MNPRQRHLLRWIAPVLFLGLLLSWAWLRPWWLTGTTPVVVTLQAPADATLALAWAEGEAPLPLVPVGDETEGMVWFWTTELPPRPDYMLELRFPEGLESGVFAAFEVFALAPRKHSLARVSATDLAAWSTTGITPGLPGNDRIHFSATKGAGFRLRTPLDRRPPWFGREAIKALGAGLVGLFLVACLVLAGLRFPAWLPEPEGRGWTRRSRWLVVVLFLAVAALFLHLSTHARPEFWLADSTSYTEKAVAWWQDGTFETGGEEYELNRLPGVPWVMAQAFALLGPSLQAVALAQAMIAVAAFGFIFWVVHAWFRPWLMAVAIPLTLLSPPVVWASHLIASESLFVSGWVLATGAFIRAWSRLGNARSLWLLLFAVLVALGTLVRANAVLLLCLPGCAAIGMGCRWWSVRSREAFPRGALAMLAVPFLLVLAANAAWSWRNFESRGYARPSDLGAAVAVNGPFISGMLDVRALAPGPEYRAVVEQRWTRGYVYPGWGLRHYRFERLAAKAPGPRTVIPALAASMHAFVAENRARLPVAARLVAWWRVLDWGVRLPTVAAFTQDPLQRSYAIVTAIEDPARAARIADGLAALAPPGMPLAYDAGVETFWIRAYNFLTPLYPWWYRTLFFAGVFAFGWALLRGRLFSALWFVPFFVNLLLNVYLLYVLDRYVQVLDSMLLFGILAAFLPAADRRPEADREKAGEVYSWQDFLDRR